jgi:hypothetical protein
MNEGSAAVESFWRFRELPLDDFTQNLERHLDVFREAELTRTTAGKFIDFIKATVDAGEGLPPWLIPAFARVHQAYRNAEGLGRADAPPRQAETYRSTAGALGFLAGDDSDPAQWIRAFREGRARPFLLLAFAKRKVVEAAPAVVEAFLALPEDTPSEAALDYVLCLRALTGNDFGFNEEKWRRWQAEGVK